MKAEWMRKLYDVLNGLSKLIPELKWDRYVGDETQYVVYGWINTDGKQRDFVVVCVHAEGTWYTTSSAKWSEKIAELIYGPDCGHIDCRYVDELWKEFSEVFF